MNINVFTLKAIADCQLFFSSYNADQSLFNGNTGIMPFFFYYALFAGNHYHEDIAGELLNDVCIHPSVDLSITFLGGIFGIEWSIEYMKKQGFVEGDTDEILAEYHYSTKCQMDLKRKNTDGSIISFALDSAEHMKHAPKRTKMENMLFLLTMYKIDGFSYFQREIVNAPHSTIKRMAEVIEMRVSGILPLVMWGVLSYNFIDLDFYTGKDKTAILLNKYCKQRQTIKL